MKVKISKSMTQPMVYGVVAAWIVAGGLACFVFMRYTSQTSVTIPLAITGILLLAVLPALRRGAWVYTNARKYHTAEYLYELGNGAAISVAVDGYEKKVKKAVAAWVKRKLISVSFGVLPVTFFAFLLAGCGWLRSLLSVLVMALMVVVGVWLGVEVMLFSARKLCYDKYGNIKNN